MKIKLNYNLNSAFGVVSKEIMQDKKISMEAKCLYAYMSSFAGSGAGFLDSSDIIRENLSMSEETYNKALANLKENKLIEL